MAVLRVVMIVRTQNWEILGHHDSYDPYDKWEPDFTGTDIVTCSNYVTGTSDLSVLMPQ